MDRWGGDMRHDDALRLPGQRLSPLPAVIKIRVKVHSDALSGQNFTRILITAGSGDSRCPGKRSASSCRWGGDMRHDDALRLPGQRLSPLPAVIKIRVKFCVIRAKFYPDFNHRGQRRQPLPGQTERIIVTHIPGSMSCSACTPLG
jgi:hypothetical protein